MSINHLDLELARLKAVSRANVDDARLWRWYADLMEDDRVQCSRRDQLWRISIDAQFMVEDASFDSAVRRAVAAWSGLAQAPVILRRRKRRVREEARSVPSSLR